jgi:predicted transcriptional regulator
MIAVTTDNEARELELVVAIVSAYVSKHSMPAAEVPKLITTIHDTLRNLGKSEQGAAPELVPAVPVRKSVTPDYIISLEDGRKLRSLKRHLKAQYDMTPDDYRAKWGLPADYPMVAPNYAKARSELAKTMGLGRSGSSEE